MEENARQRRRRRVGSLALAALLAVGIVSGCDSSPEAANAAARLAVTAQQLADYYTDLSKQVGDSIELNQVQAEMLKLPFDASDQQRLNLTQQELDKRAALAKGLGTLASAYGALAGSKALADIDAAADQLAAQCAEIQGLPGGAAIPDVLAQAGKLLVEHIRARKLRESSEAIGQVVRAIDTMFERETPVYESIDKTRIMLAQSLALELLKEDLVDVNPLLVPALKPFELTSNLPPNHTPAEFHNLAELKIKSSGDTQIRAYRADSEAMSASLKATAQQIEAVAAKRRAGKPWYHIGG